MDRSRQASNFGDESGADSSPKKVRRENHVFGPYQLSGLLGSGGMAEVWRAERCAPPGIGMWVALKRIRRTICCDAQIRDMFLREARLTAQLRHHNIVNTIDVGEVEGQPYIAMELIDGVSLRQLLRASDGPLPLAMSIWIVRELARALSYAHKVTDGSGAPLAIIHRDIKPANVLFTRSGGVKLLDFGLAKTPSWTVPTTKHGVLKGTLGYMAPEMIRGHAYDQRVDLFGLGVLLHELLTNERLFFHEDELATLALNEACVVAPPSMSNPGIPERLDRITLQALHPDPEQRLDSADALIVELDGFLQKQPWNAAWTASALQQRMGWSSVETPISDELSTSVFRPRAVSMVRRMSRPSMVIGASLVALAGLVHTGRHAAISPMANAAVAPPVVRQEHGPRSVRAVAVIGFKNAAGRAEDAWLSTALAEMLAIQLHQAERLHVLPADEVARMKSELSLTGAASLPGDSLERVRRYLDADLVLLGGYSSLGGASRALELKLRVQDTASGATVASVTELGSESDLFALAAHAGQSLMTQLDVASPLAERAIRATMPANLDAARAYAEGLTQLRANDGLRAREELQAAVAADPSHAASHLALAQSWALLGYEHRAAESAERALALAPSLPREQRMNVEGYYYFVTHHWPRAVDTYRALSELFPDTLDYTLKLSQSLEHSGHREDALALLDRVRASSLPQRNDLQLDLNRGWTLIRMNRAREALEAGKEAERKARARGAELMAAAALHVQGIAYLSLYQCDRAIEVSKVAQAIFARANNQRGVTSVSNDIANCLGQEQDYAGALRIHDQNAAINESIGNVRGLASELQNSVGPLIELGRAAEAFGRIERSSAAFREVGEDRVDLNYLRSHASLLIRTGDLTAATRELRELIVQVDALEDGDLQTTARVSLAAARREGGDPAEARRLVEQALVRARQTDDADLVHYVLEEQSATLRTADKLQAARRSLEQAKQLLEKSASPKLGVIELSLSMAALDLDRGWAATTEAIIRDQLGDPLLKNERVKSEAYEILALSLLKRGQLTEARDAINLALAGARYRSFVSREYLLISQARVEAAEGRAESAQRRLVDVLLAARQARFVELELEAEVVRFELGLAHGGSSSGESAANFARRAARHGYALVARRASASVATARATN
jgi:serine/threonine protein kinase/Tfp pilus assembly protein PilF